MDNTLQSFTFIINMDVVLNPLFNCESRCLVGNVNKQKSISFLIAAGDFNQQNKQIKKIIKECNFEFYDQISCFKNISLENAKNEYEEFLKLKEPLKYIHNRYSSSIFQTEF